MPGRPSDAITATQRSFVEARGGSLDSRGWTTNYRLNLFQPLHRDTLHDFREVGEIGPSGEGGRISAPHSSTALAVNAFDFWRGRDLTNLGDSLDMALGNVLGFERRHFFGLKRASQPDVCFLTSTGSHVAVEVKLREPYGTVSNSFSDLYFTTPGLWDGLPRLRAHAEAITSGDESYSSLGAAQLIKHGLGLHRACPSGSSLLYFWHFEESEIALQHQAELATFTAAVSDELTIAAVTIAELAERFTPDKATRNWHIYLTQRYLEN